jgi:hypothetical protein
MAATVLGHMSKKANGDETGHFFKTKKGRGVMRSIKNVGFNQNWFHFE